jgi:uncharacterized protein
MPAALTYPGVYIEEVPSGVRTISGVPTSIALFVGWAPRGLVNITTKLGRLRITSFADYERNFGGLDSRTLLGHSVRHFFDNGGADAYVVRLVADDAATASVITGDITVSANSPGAWANRYRIKTTIRPDLTSRFGIQVLDHANNDAIVESFENLSMDDASERYAEAVINERSAFITVDVADAGAPSAPPVDGTIDLNGDVSGDDGTVLEPNTGDFETKLLAQFGTGTVTDQIDIFNLVCVPGETNEGTLTTLQKHCSDKRAFLIIDAKREDQRADLTGGATGLTGDDAKNSAIFFPWVRAPDPLKQRALADFPPCGFVAGIFARTDSTRGVWKAPAGSDASLTGVAGFKLTLSDAENGQLNPVAINCLRTLPVYGNVVWGSRTLHGQNERGSEWKYIPVRRMALFLEETLYRATQWVVFEPNDEPLWAQIRLNIGAFLQGLFRQGAFQGRTAREAYFVKCDRETTTQADINLGIVNIHVGFAPLKPAEFVVIKLQQIAGDIPT